MEVKYGHAFHHLFARFISVISNKSAENEIKTARKRKKQKYTRKARRRSKIQNHFHLQITKPKPSNWNACRRNRCGVCVFVECEPMELHFNLSF